MLAQPGDVLGLALEAAGRLAHHGRTGRGDDGVDRPGPSTPDVATDTTTSAPTPDPVDPPVDPPEVAPGVVPDDLLPADEIAWSRDGETVTYDDSTARVEGRTAEVTIGGDTLTAQLPLEAESGLAPFTLPLGQAGEQLADDPVAEVTGGSGDEDGGHDEVLFSV